MPTLRGLALLLVGVAAVAQAAPIPPALEVLALAGDGDSGATQLYALSPTAAPRALGRLLHVPGSSVKGALLGNRRVAAVAERDANRERSWSGALYLMVEGRTEALVNQVYEGSWPVAVSDSRVLVARGEAGPGFPELTGEQRVDTIAIDEVDVATGRVQRLYEARGYLALPIGQHEGSTYLAQIDRHGVSLIGVHPAGGVRVVATELLLGRDFSIDRERNSIVCQVRHLERRDLWQVIEIDLATGEKKQVLDGDHYAMLPAVWPGGQLLLLNRTRRAGPTLWDLRTHKLVAAPLAIGEGLVELAATAADRRGLALVQHTPRARRAWLFDTRAALSFPLILPQGEPRLEIVGVVPTEVRR